MTLATFADLDAQIAAIRLAGVCRERRESYGVTAMTMLDACREMQAVTRWDLVIHEVEIDLVEIRPDSDPYFAQHGSCLPWLEHERRRNAYPPNVYRGVAETLERESGESRHDFAERAEERAAELTASHEGNRLHAKWRRREVESREVREIRFRAGKEAMYAAQERLSIRWAFEDWRDALPVATQQQLASLPVDQAADFILDFGGRPEWVPLAYIDPQEVPS